MKRNIAALLTIVLLSSALTVSAKSVQTKTTRSTVTKVVKVDINTAPEADMVAVGLDKSTAKKIVDGRPWRTKRELLSFRLLTTEQYEQVKEQIIAHRAK